MRSKKSMMSNMAKTHDEIRHLTAANLKRIREAKGLSQTELARRINSHASTLNAIENEKQGLGKDLLVRICQALSVDAIEFTRNIHDMASIPPPSGEIAVISMCEGGPAGFYEAPYPNGGGFRYIKRPYDVTDPAAYAVEVRGDSMVPRYEPGETVIASPEKEVRSGDYVIVRMVSGEVAIKRIKFRDEIVILSSVNPAVEAWVCNPEEIVSYHKVVWKKENP